MSVIKRDPWLVRNTKRLITVLSSPGQVRYLRRWWGSLKPGYDAIEFLTSRIIPGWRVFEYGSGGSTLFWLERGAEVVSVEHDPQWYSQLQENTIQHPKLEYRLILPEPGDICGPLSLSSISDPYCYQSSNVQFAGMNFRRYASQIDEFPDQHFDLVIVDGRARPSCLMHSVRKVKIGGMLVLDNADRDYYLARTHPLLKGFTLHRFRGLAPGSVVYTQTNVYVRQS
jgi:hypothetical protein